MKNTEKANLDQLATDILTNFSAYAADPLKFVSERLPSHESSIIIKNNSPVLPFNGSKAWH